MATPVGDLETEWETYETEFKKAETELLHHSQQHNEKGKEMKTKLAKFCHLIGSTLAESELISDDEKGRLEALKRQAEQVGVKLSEMFRDEAIEKLKTSYKEAKESPSWDNTISTASLLAKLGDDSVFRFLSDAVNLCEGEPVRFSSTRPVTGSLCISSPPPKKQKE